MQQQRLITDAQTHHDKQHSRERIHIMFTNSDGLSDQYTPSRPQCLCQEHQQQWIPTHLLHDIRLIA